MTARTLIWRSLCYRLRSHLGVVLGAAVGSAALVGALVVGDSVRESLREMALRRLGNIHYALAPHDRLFRADLAADLGRRFAERYDLPNKGEFISLFKLPATASLPDGSARANRVQLLGVDSHFC